MNDPTLVVDQLPSHAGVDPYNKRIDRNSNDSLTKVKSKAPRQQLTSYP